MSLPELAVPVASAATLGVALRYGSDAVLRLVAGITAIVAKDDKQTRAQRALEVLRALRRDGQAPPLEAGPPTDALGSEPQQRCQRSSCEEIWWSPLCRPVRRLLGRREDPPLSSS
jgi:hypothetical protein